MPRCVRNDGWGLSGRFRAEDALEAGAGELDTNKFFTSGRGIADVNDTAVRGEIGVTVSGGRKTVSPRGTGEPFGLGTARPIVCQGDADFEIGADGDVKTRDKSSAIAAKIFTGGIFFEGEAVGVAPANFQRQAGSDSTFRALLRNGGARDRDHWRGPAVFHSRSVRHFPTPTALPHH